MFNFFILDFIITIDCRFNGRSYFEGALVLLDDYVVK